MTIRTLPLPLPSGAFHTRRTDVLIVGAGPAGCMAAATLVRYDMDFCLIDKRPTRTQTGHASAFQPRTQEILQTMDLLHTLDGKGHRLTETSFWNRDSQGKLVRTYVGSEVVHPTPYQYLFNTDQGLTEDTYEAFLTSKGQKIHRFMELIDYEYNVDDHKWPITAYIKNNATGGVEAWLTKYILGTDGARSATRKVTGIQSDTQGGEDVWAVADVYLDTNFPDYRRRCAIRTPQGGCMLIPRKDEGLRIFLQVDEKSKALLGATKDLQHQPAQTGLRENGAYKLTQFIQSHINNVLHPYKADITGIVWISRYHVTQRVVQHFHDEHQRVFLLGDACHTHSPKAGQGMNVSICDAYNLTWKLALVLRGLASPDLLHTYEVERLQIAQQLVEFDARFARQFGQTEDVDSQNLRETWEEGHGFTSGCGYRYPPSLIVLPTVGTPIADHAVEPLTPGKRLLPIDLVRHVDGNHYNLLDVMPSNGRFHLFVFAGDQLASASFNKLAESLNSHRSPLHLFNCLPLNLMKRFRHEDIKTDPIPAYNKDYLIDLFVVHSSDHLDVTLEELPAPFSTHWSMRVYRDIGGQGHKILGVPEQSGALAVVRPDGYIGLVTALDRLDQVTAYFEGFMCKRI